MAELSSYPPVTTLADTDRIPVITNPGVAGGNKYITAADLAADVAAQPSLSSRYASVFAVDGYAGATDDIKFAAALAAWSAHGGAGDIVFGARTYTMANQWAIPNDGAAPQPNQMSLRIRGAGAGHRGSSGVPLGGTIIDFTAATAPAKIDTRGHGLLCLEDITFRDTSGGTTPFFQTTNTTPIIQRCMFFGSVTKGGATCDQDAIILGGGTRNYDGTATAKFDGYKPIVRDCHFNRIRRCVWLRAGCNDALIESNAIWINCGAPSAAYGAIDLLGDVAGAIVGNVIANNTIEVANYPTAIRVGAYSKGNSLLGNGLYDPTASTVQGIYFDDTAQYNLVVQGYSDDTFPHYVEHANVAYSNTVLTSHASRASHFAQPVTFHGVDTANGALRVVGNSRAVFASAAVNKSLGGIRIQPESDLNESAALIEVLRSDLDDLGAGQAVWRLQQNGDIIITNSAGVTSTWSAGGRTLTVTGGILLSTGTGGSNIDVRGAGLRLLNAAAGTELIRFRASPTSSTRGAIQFNVTGPIWVVVTGTPEGVVTAPIGSIATRDDGGAVTTMYVKESGVGNTGWVAK